MHPTPSTARQTIQICIYRERESEHWNVQFVLFVNICDLLCFGLYSGRMLAYNYMCVYGSFGWCSFLLFWFDFLPLLLSCWYSVRVFFFFLLSSFMCMLLYKSVCVCFVRLCLSWANTKTGISFVFFFSSLFGYCRISRQCPWLHETIILRKAYRIFSLLLLVFILLVCVTYIMLCVIRQCVCALLPISDRYEHKQTYEERTNFLVARYLILQWRKQTDE